MESKYFLNLNSMTERKIDCTRQGFSESDGPKENLLHHLLLIQEQDQKKRDQFETTPLILFCILFCFWKQYLTKHILQRLNLEMGFVF